jgi:glutathione S-transferase
VRLLLHSSTATSGTIAHMVLAESGLPFDVRFLSVRNGETRTPEYLAINPKGEVPALDVDGTIVTEIPAICGLVGDLAPDSGLMPQSPLGRAEAQSWLAWCSFRLGSAFVHAFVPARLSKDEAAQADIRAACVSNINRQLRLANAVLARQPMLCGEAPTAGDFYLAMLSRWAGRLGAEVPDAVAAHRDTIFARPAVRQVFVREEIAA